MESHNRMNVKHRTCIQLFKRDKCIKTEVMFSICVGGECERQGQDGDDNAVAIFTFKGLYIRETLSINSDGKAGTLTLQRPEVSFSNLKRELPEAGRVNADSLNLIDNSINSFRGGSWWWKWWRTSFSSLVSMPADDEGKCYCLYQKNPGNHLPLWP